MASEGIFIIIICMHYATNKLNFGLFIDTLIIEFTYEKVFFFLRFYLFFLERGRKGEREEQKHQCVVAT